MNLPDRRDIARHIGLPCMIKRERAGQALFISDYSMRLSADQSAEAEKRLMRSGYLIAPQGGMALVDWAPERYLRFFESLDAAAAESAPLHGVATLLIRHPSMAGEQDLPLLSRALRLYLIQEKDKLIRLAEQGLAEALRERRPPPYHLLPLLCEKIQ